MYMCSMLLCLVSLEVRASDPLELEIVMCSTNNKPPETDTGIQVEDQSAKLATLISHTG